MRYLHSKAGQHRVFIRALRSVGMEVTDFTWHDCQFWCCEFRKLLAKSSLSDKAPEIRSAGL